MHSELEHTLARELEDLASNLDVPPLPDLPATPAGRRRWHTVAPVLVAAAVVVAVLAVVVRFAGPESREPAPAPSPTRIVDNGPVSTAAPSSPVVVAGRLYVGGQQVAGRWSSVEGAGTRWVGQREPGSCGGATTPNHRSSTGRWTSHQPSPRPAATWLACSARVATRSWSVPQPSGAARVSAG